MKKNNINKTIMLNNKANCYVIDQKGKLVSKINYNKGWFYIRKQKAFFYNKNPFIVKLDKIIDKPINNLSENEKIYIQKFIGGKTMDKKEKLKAMANAIKQLEKTTKKQGIAYKLGDKPFTKVDVIPTGALPLDMALGCGGWGRGRIVELFGK